MQYARHYEECKVIPAKQEELFAFINDHSQLTSHMGNSSWMLGGGRMETSVDDGRGQRVGSHIRLSGRAFGIRIYLEEVVTVYDPPHYKVWETARDPKLLVIGSYSMGVEVKRQDNNSLLRVFIDYDLPKANVWLGKLFGDIYAKWCVRQMIQNAYNQHTRQRLQ